MTLQADLRPLLDALNSTIEVSARFRFPYSFSPAPASQAEREFAHQAAFAGAWGDEPLAEILTPTFLLVNSAEDHLRALGRLLVEEDSRYAPLSGPSCLGVSRTRLVDSRHHANVRRTALPRLELPPTWAQRKEEAGAGVGN